MLRAACLTCAIVFSATGFAVLAAQPLEEAKSLKYSGKMADGTKVEFEQSAKLKMTFSNGWDLTRVEPGMDRAGRRFSGIGKAGDKNLVVAGSMRPDEITVQVTVGIGKGAMSETVKLSRDR